MGAEREHEPVLLVVGLLTGCPEAVAWVEQRLGQAFGPVLAKGGPFAFTESDYYARTMGQGLAFRFFAFQNLIRPEWLGPIKRYTNRLETTYAVHAQHGELPGGHLLRPINLDPGYLHHSKWIMATTKDQSHRVYLGEGIYADPMLHFVRGRWQPWPWTYPNYRRADYLELFATLRSLYLEQRKRCAQRFWN